MNYFGRGKGRGERGERERGGGDNKEAFVLHRPIDKTLSILQMVR